MNHAPPAEAPEEELDFNTVLENDLANIIRKSASGQPLTKREREMVEEERDRRNQKPAFQLAAEKPPGPLTGLTQQEIAEKYGYSYRAVKLWVADGRKANDPAPLDDPPAMPAWFARIYSPRNAPDRLIRACQALSNLTRPSEKAPASPPITRIEISDAEKGLLAMLERVRTAEAEMHARYMEAVAAGDRDKADYLAAEWQKSVEKLRALEKSAPQSLADAGIYVRKDDVTRDLIQLHAGIIKAFKQALRKSRVELRATTSTEEWNLLSDRIIDDTCTALVEDNFREPLILAPA
jgi:hypothetical protein